MLLDPFGRHRRASLQGCAVAIMAFAWLDVLVDRADVEATLVIRAACAAALLAAAQFVVSRPRPALWLASLSAVVAVAVIAFLQGGIASPNLAWLLVVAMIAPLVAGGDRALVAVTGALCVVAVGAVLVALHQEGQTIAAWMGSTLASSTLALFVADRLQVMQTRSGQAEAELRRAEVRREHAERLAMLGQLSAGVAHEIRNPLSFVKANLGVLGRDGSEDVKEIVEESLSGLRRIETTIQDLSRFARAPSESLDVLDVRSVVDVACRIASTKLRDVASVRVELPGDPTMLGSEQRLVQVFVNLLVNAVDALQVTAYEDRCIRVRSRTLPGQRLAIDFEDSGPGVPGSLRDRVFEPFFTTKPESQGTGLGLALCRELVQRCGGSLALGASDLGGACFTVVLDAGSTVESRPPTTLESEYTDGRADR